jgi:hypothetical protein
VTDFRTRLGLNEESAKTDFVDRINQRLAVITSARETPLAMLCKATHLRANPGPQIRPSMRSQLLFLSFLPALASFAAESAAPARPVTTKADKPAEVTAKADKKDEKEKEPVLSVTEHSLAVGGKALRYKATAGYMAMKDAKMEKTKANIFFVAYTKLPGDGEKPVDLATRPL